MTIGLLRHVVICSLASLVVSSEASAQLIKRPPRQARPLFRGPQPPRASNELIFDANLLGGYDRNLTTGTSTLTSTGQGTPLGTPWPSAYSGVIDAGLDYNRGGASRSFGADGRGYVNTYRNVGVSPQFGGEVNLSEKTSIGRRNSFQATQGATYAPFFSLGIFGRPGGLGGNPTSAFTNGRTWNLDGGASFDREWTRNFSTTASYQYNRRGYNGVTIARRAVGQVGPFNNDSHSGSLELVRKIGRTMNARSEYRRSVSNTIQAGGTFRPITHDTIEAGWSYSRDVSRTRTFSLALGGGGSYVQASAFQSGLPYEYWAPTAYGTTSFDLGRTWTTTAQYRRSVIVLPGLNAALQEFISHGATLGVGGMIGNRTELSFSAIYSNGNTGTVAVLTGSTRNKYDAYTGTAQVGYALTSWWQAMANFSFVDTRLNAAASQSLGVVPQLQRSSVRVGFSWLVPIIAPRGGPGQRRG